MKRLIIALSVLTILVSMGSVRAENSATMYTGRSYGEQQVFVDMMNNSGGDVSSNKVVILDIQGGAVPGTTLGSGFATTGTAGATTFGHIIGVTDESIASGSIGRICIRGPHRVLFTTAPTLFGQSVTSSTTVGNADTATSTATGYNYLGISLRPTLTTDPNWSSLMWWIWVQPSRQ